MYWTAESFPYGMVLFLLVGLFYLVRALLGFGDRRVIPGMLVLVVAMLGTLALSYFGI